MTITIADRRGALWQWDTGRRLRVGSGVEQIHYQNRALGRSVDVDVGDDGTAIIPDELLQDCHTLTAYVYVTDDTGAYTMEQHDFIVHKRAKPAGYVYTPTDQLTLQAIQRQIGDLSDLTTAEKGTLVAAINEVALAGGAGSIGLRVADGYIQYSTDSGSTWTNLIAVADLKGAKGDRGEPGAKGEPGEKGDTGAQGVKGDTGPTGPAGPQGVPGKDGVNGETGPAGPRGPAGVPGKDGVDGKPGAAGADGITPHIGDNGNWYLGTTDTGKPSRGATGAKGDVGATGPAGPTGPVGPQGPAGAPGKDGAGMDITGATVGQIAKITAVNASGVPIAWEPVDMPSGGSPDAVLYTAQTLADVQKRQARDNIDAASEFVVNGSENSTGGITLDKTAKQIQDAVSMGKTPVVRIGSVYLPLIMDAGTDFIFGVSAPGGSNGAVLNALSVGESGVQLIRADLLSTDANGVLPQQTMAYNPRTDMEIATRGYVDDGLAKKAPAGDYVTNSALNGKGYLTLATLPKYTGGVS